MFVMLETIKMKNFGVPSIKYARSNGGGVVQLKAYFLVWREGWFSFTRTYIINLFSQVPYKIEIK